MNKSAKRLHLLSPIFFTHNKKRKKKKPLKKKHLERLLQQFKKQSTKKV